MSKFSKKKGGDVPAISTASLPDIVFMLLFFFMVATVMRENELSVENTLPMANQVEKLEDRNMLIYIYVGKPTAAYQKQYGENEVIQLGDKIEPAFKVYDYVNTKRNSMAENLQDRMMVSLKVDGEARIGALTDVKEYLRKANALKVNYTARKGDPMKNLNR